MTPAIYIVYLLSGSNGFLDITCFVNKARITIDGDNNLYIGGYKSGDDTDATVTFGRLSVTANGVTGLPTGKEIQPHPHVRTAKKLLLPESDAATRIGAFYCEAQKDGNVNEKIPAIIMASNSKRK